MSGPVISFDLARSKGAVETVRVTSAPANTPETAPPDQDMTRAGLAVSYAGVIGAEITTADMVEAMGALTPATSAADAMRAGLTASGLSARIEKTRRDRQQSWPAIALMSTGEVVLVLAEDGDKITLHDPSARGNCTNVDKDAFDRHFSGRVLKAELTPAQIAARHAVATKPAHWFWGEFPRFRRQIVEIGLGSFVANMLAVAVALFSLQVYDRVIPHQSEATLWVLALGAGLAILMESFLKMSRARLLDASGRKIEMRVQSVLMDRLLGMRAGQGGQTPSGLFSAMREFSSIRELFTASTIGGLTDLPFIFLFLALVASIAGPLVWVLIIGGCLMVIPSFFLQKRLVALTQATQGATVKSSRLLHEAIYEADTVKAHRGEERFRRLWSELTAVSSSASAESRKLSASLTFWSQGVQQATYVSAVVGGTFMVFAGQFTIGAIIAVGILTSRTLAPLTGLAGTLARWSNVKAALDALDQVAGAEQDHDPARTYLRRDRLHGGFELRGLRYAYEPDAAPTLDLEALQILPGQRLGVLGANGSGKSTLLRLLSGLATPTEGRVLIDGVDMGQLHPKDLRREIGYLSQEVRLFAGTLRDNLNLDQLERDDERMFDALEFAGLGAHVRAHAKGLDLEIRDGGAGLSIGQRQSIGWARLWLQDPQICLLDEPTAALDSSLEAALIERLSGWLEGRTAIIATHRVPILSLTTRTLMLAQGRLVVDGPRDEVLAHLARQKAS